MLTGSLYGVWSIDVAIKRYRKVWRTDPPWAVTVRTVRGVTDGDRNCNLSEISKAAKLSVLNDKVISLTAAENWENQKYMNGEHDEVTVRSTYQGQH